MSPFTGSTAGKVRDREAARAWRATSPAPVVFTNGVFDLLHPGHVELLEAARREGAVLVVGVNADVSARRLAKGAGRPVAGEEDRARVVAGLAAVDCVVLFDEDTPLELIRELAPDVLVKGADYARDRIVGADWVEARGGRVVRVPLVSGFSTSALVERLRAST
jgi:rfaE bifunctional protein nucleotidyltransferase chain/domain